MAPKIEAARDRQRGIALGILWLLAAAPVAAQVPGTMAADRARLVEITGDTSQLPRFGAVPVTALLPALASPLARLPVAFLLPDIRVVHNSALPYSLNDGPLWAGRGWNASVTAGLTTTHLGRGVLLRITLAPTLFYSQNAPFQIAPDTSGQRSGYANPFHVLPYSMDLPQRFGDRHLLGFDPGRSEVAAEWPRVSVGVTASPEWWGPGVRNALTMSTNAAGVPRIYVKTTRPVRSRVGSLDARLVSGTLTQSRFFSESANENRTLSGLVVQLAPAFDSTLTLGFARVVYAPVGPQASPFTLTLARSFDALTRWENVALTGQRSDQIMSLFARWVFPDAGFEVYGEWARMDLPRNVTELLTAGHHSAGWTMGFQWATPRRGGAYLRLQSELTYLEQSRVFPDRPLPDFYAGVASPQGFTQRGQVIGAAIGPGASSQWLAADWMARRWQLGVFAGRVRWENDALYRQPRITFFHHDVSLLSGIRGGWRGPLTDFAAELTVARRYNYLFQNGRVSPGGFRTVDVGNITLALAATPR